MFDFTPEQIGLISFCIVTASILPYAIRIFLGHADTSVTGWVISTFTGLVIFLTYGGIGATSNIWIALIELIDPAIIVLAALLYRSKWVWPDVYDWVAVALSIVALIIHTLSYHAGAPLWAYVGAFAADIFAAIPVVMFAWKNPDKEQPLAWLLSIFGISISFFSIQVLTAEQLSLPIYQLVFSVLVFAPAFYFYVKNKVPLRKWM